MFSRTSSKASMRKVESDAEATQRSITIITLELARARIASRPHFEQSKSPVDALEGG